MLLSHNDISWLRLPGTMFDEQSPVGYVNFDAQARVTDMNSTAAKLLGVRRKEFLGMPFPAALGATEVPKFLEHLRRCRGGQERQISTELDLGKKNGARIPVELTTAPATIQGQPRFPTTIIDLRRVQQRLQMLLESKMLAEDLFEFVSHPLVALSEDLVIEATNSAFRDRFQVRARELHGHPLFDLEMLRWPDEEFSHALRRAVTRRKSLREMMVECSLVGLGKRLTLLASAMPVFQRPGVRPLLLLTFEDITLRRRHEQERETILAQLQEMNAKLEERVRDRTAELNELNAQLKALSQRVIETQEIERRALARELHDEVGQALTGLNMLLHRASDGAAAGAPGKIREARQIVADLMKHVRRMSVDLRPPVLDDLGLCAAVQSHVDAFSRRTGIQVSFKGDVVPEERVSAAAKITAFRCVQETLTNVARHAQSTEASVALRCNGSKLLLEVKDQGQGFDPAKEARGGGSGLSGMRERVTLAGGQLDLESRPGRGTRVFVQLPLQVKGGKA